MRIICVSSYAVLRVIRIQSASPPRSPSPTELEEGEVVPCCTLDSPFLHLGWGKGAGGIGAAFGNRTRLYPYLDTNWVYINTPLREKIILAIPTILLTLTLFALIIPHTITALQGELPLGGDQGQHTEIDALAAYLNTELRGKTVYDHWLGWELAYYLGQEPQIRLIYQALPETLADDMRAQIEHPETRYFVAPSPEAAAPWADALRRAGIQVTPIPYASFIVYALEVTSSHE